MEPRQPFPLAATLRTPPFHPCFLFTKLLLLLPLFFFALFSHGSLSEARPGTVRVGVLVDNNTRVGREMEVAVRVAARRFNNDSATHPELSLFFRNPGGSPLRAASIAEELISQNNVQVILGMTAWEEGALVAEIGNRNQLPIVSLSSTIGTQSLAQQRWPFLVQTGGNVSEEINCIASMIHSFNWRKVIVIQELNTYGGDSGIFSAFTQSLQEFCVEVEYHLSLAPFSSLSDPGEFLSKEVAELLRKQSRVFVVLRSSLSMATILFKEAKKLGLVGKESVWIVTESISSQLDALDASVISTMEGALGVRTFFAEDTTAFLDFKNQFRKALRFEYPEEESSEMGNFAIRAFDSMHTIAQATRKLNDTNSTSTKLLDLILSSNFTGLSGEIRFDKGQLSKSSAFSIVNVVGRKYKDIGFWLPKLGFLESLPGKESEGDSTNAMKVLSDKVNWPGGLNRTPKGWWRPTGAKPLRVGVPGRTSFEKFVKVDWNVEPISYRNYHGFCIDIFHEVLKKLDYPLVFDFIPYNGTYDDLVDHVANKTWDAIIGDVTILANRSEHVQFTQPYADSGLTMIVPVKHERQKAWMFLKPFTLEMWVATCGILIYTVLVVWLLEGETNPEFEGPWTEQLSTAFWFTSSALFFAHREKVQNKYTRVVVLVWLFVVLALSSSYTASLSSMLTIRRLEPKVTDIEWIKKNNKTVGCDGDSFVYKYLVEVLQLSPSNIKNISSQDFYPGEFESGNITAAFLEIPYEKAFLNIYCKGYTKVPTMSYGGDRFGGLGFVFQKGSPMADDFSRAILTLLENGTLKKLDSYWFAPTPSCLATEKMEKNDSLRLGSFWGLFLLSVLTSTVNYFMFIGHRLYIRHREAYQNYRFRAIELVRFFHNI